MADDAKPGFKIASAYVSIEASDTGLRESMAAKVRAAAEGLDAQVKLNLDGADLRQKVKTEVAGASGEGVKVPIDVDGDKLRTKVKTEIEGAGAGEKIKVPLEVDHHSFEQEFRAAMGAAETAAADADRAIRDSFSDIERASRTLRAGATDVADEMENVAGKAVSAGSSAAQAGGGFASGAGGISTMLGAVLALGPALTIIGPALAGAGLAAFTVGSAFASVAGALKDHAAAATAVGVSGAQLAVTENSNAVAIRNAKQTIVDADRSAEQAQVASAARIVSAQQSLADAERSAATAAQSSADSVVSAQLRVEDATYSLGQARQSEISALYTQQQAQEALTLAQEDAANTIADLDNATARSKLSVESAVNSEAAAQLNLDLAKRNGMATPAQLADLDLKLREAKLSVVEARQRETEATQKSNRADAEGVAQLPSVVNAQHAVEQAAQGVASAQHGVTQALQGQADAQHALMLAQQAQVNQQITSAESVKRAQQSVTDAVKAAAEQQRASAESVQKATQALADTQRSQALEAAAAAQSAGASANKFAQDMAKGTPEMRALVEQILSMKGGFDQLKQTAQSALLPGFTQMLKDIQPMLGPFNEAVKSMGGVLGGLATQFGALFNDPAFRKAFVELLQQGTQLVGQLGSGFIDMFGKLVSAAGPAAPIVSAIGQGLHDLMASGIPDFFRGLTTDAGGSAQTFKAILGAVSDLLGPIGKLSGAVSGALGPVLTALRPVIKQVADVFVDAVVPVLKDLSPILVVIAQLIGALMPVVAPVIQIFMELADQLLKALLPAIQPLIPVITEMAGKIGQSLVQAMVALMPSFQQLIKAFIELLPPLIPLIPLIGDLIALVIQIAVPFIEFNSAITSLILDALHPMEVVLSWLLQAIIPPFIQIVKDMSTPFRSLGDAAREGVDWVKSHLGDMILWIADLPGKLATIGAHMWDWVTSGISGIATVVAGSFKTIFNDIIATINWAIDQANGMTGGISSAWDWIPGTSDIPAIPHIPKLYRGGTAAGGGVAVVGDAGPELMVMPPAASIVPLPPGTNSADLMNKSSQSITNNFNYYGTQHPTVETQAIMKRQFATAVLG